MTVKEDPSIRADSASTRAMLHGFTHRTHPEGFPPGAQSSLRWPVDALRSFMGGNIKTRAARSPSGSRRAETMTQASRDHDLNSALAFAAPAFLDRFNGLCEKGVDALEVVIMTFQAAPVRREAR